MRRSKEIIVLLVLLLGSVAFVLWFVVKRRAEIRADPITHAPRERGPLLDSASKTVPIEDGKTIDFSSGRPVVKDSPEDRAALQQGLKDIEEATKDIVFEAQKKPDPKKP